MGFRFDSSLLSLGEEGKHSKVKTNTPHSTPHLYNVVFVQLEAAATTRTQLSDTSRSILAEAGLGSQSHSGVWPRTSDATNRIQLCNTAPNILCVCSI